MDDTEKRIFNCFCNHYYTEYQHEYKSYEGRVAPLNRIEYLTRNYSFLLNKWDEEKSQWYSREEIS